MEKELRYLKIYSGLLTVVCLILFALIFVRLGSKKFAEIDVERINVIEADGKLRMVISNRSRQHPGVMDGITYDERKGERPPGMMFFGENGNEIGGLIFDSVAGKGQGGSLTFDKFRGDQTVQFIHEEDEHENYFAGLKMNDQHLPMNDLIRKEKEISKLPNKQAQDAALQTLRDSGVLMTERLKIGRDYDRSSVIKLKDAKGRVRIEMRVEADGDPKLNFLDEAGKVVLSLPEQQGKL